MKNRQVTQQLNSMQISGDQCSRVSRWAMLGCLYASAAISFVGCGSTAGDPSNGASTPTEQQNMPASPQQMNSTAPASPSDDEPSMPAAASPNSEAPPMNLPVQPAPAGRPSSPSTSGQSPAPAAEPAPPSDPPPPGPNGDGSARQAAANELALIGDSYMEVPNRELNRELSRLAREAGFIGTNESYRDNGISGTRLVGGANAIPTQYINAQRQSPIKFLVMNGSGNDFLAANCTDCQALSNAVTAVEDLLDTVAADGTVQHVIYYFYPDLTFSPLFPAAADFLRPQMQAACENSPVPCHFLDLRPVFAGHPEFIGPDNLHPSVPGSDAMAGALFDIIEANPITD
jgi:hypothetical protein